MKGHSLYALGRLKPGEMNRTEQAYSLLLAERQANGEVAWWAFEGVTLKLAEGSRYTPDFFVMLVDGTLECHEVKSRWLGDAKTKMRVAAEKFPFRFQAMFAVPKRDGGGWKVEEF